MRLLETCLEMIEQRIASKPSRYPSAARGRWDDLRESEDQTPTGLARHAGWCGGAIGHGFAGAFTTEGCAPCPADFSYRPSTHVDLPGRQVVFWHAASSDHAPRSSTMCTQWEARSMTLARMALTPAFALLISVPTIGAQQAGPARLPDPAQLRFVDFAPGLASAPLEGDPSQPGAPYRFVLRIAPGRWIPPHTHNLAKLLLVLRGELRLGHGAVIDSTAVRSFRVGDTVTVSAEHPHFEGGRDTTLVIVSGTGPLTTRWLQRP